VDPRHDQSGQALLRSEAVTSILNCAAALGHVPSPNEYQHWTPNRREDGPLKPQPQEE
jgi:hypothetical protein